jgi:hypothetical protein
VHPARVIDELMGHQRNRGELEGSSRIGASYRHTTPEMAARVVQAVDLRLALVLQVAEVITPSRAGPERSGLLARRTVHRLRRHQGPTVGWLASSSIAPR